MARTIEAGILSVFLALVPVCIAAQDASLTVAPSQTSGQINVPLGQSITVTTAVVIGRLAVGSPEVADIVPLDQKSFNLTGMSIGRTNVTLFGPDGAVAGVLNVEVNPDIGDLQRTLAQAVPNANVRVGTANGRLHLSGSVPDAVALQRVLDIAGQYGNQPVINALRVASPQQVLLEVRLIEASRSSGKELGISWFAQDGSTTVFSGSSNSTGVNPDGVLSSGSAPFGTLLTRIIAFGVDADVLIQALENNGLARRLAEPNLVALSGEQASFLAGGEVPIPVAQSDGNISVEFKEFGVRLTFTPTVLDNGLINLVMEPEVSQVDNSNPVTINDITVPSFVSRRVRTTVELRSGQSFAVAGLLQTTNVRAQQQVPVLGSIPVIGALFRSASFQRQETDLVVIVTPQLVQPTGPGTPLGTPLDTARSSNSVELFFLGKNEVDRSDLVGFAEGRGVTGSYGHMLDLLD